MSQASLFGGALAGDATLSPCGTYRYVLTREWGGRGTLVAIGLNPSTADATVPDPTTTRLVNRGRTLAGRLVLVNLYALRSRDPALLGTHPDPIGPDWLRTMGEVLDAVDPTTDVVLAAWGASGPPGHQVDRVSAMLRRRRIGSWCLGRCQDGSPRHPLYVRGDAPLVPWSQP